MQKKILIVDDEENIRKTVQDLLETKECKVIEAEDGRSALNLIRKEDFDLIILDIMMPEMSGWEVFQKISNSTKQYKNKVIFLTVVEISPDRKKELVKKGALTYVTKPFDVEKLSKIVEGALK